MRSNSEELQREEKETRTFQKTGGGRNRRRRPARGSLSALFVHPRRRRHGHLFFCSRFQTAVVSLLRLHSLDATTRL